VRSRPVSYYVVDGFDLRREMTRLRRLPVFGGPAGFLARRAPELAVRRATRRPRSCLGFAVPAEWRISVTAYPGVRRGDLEETLLHELVHLHVGVGRGSRRWHGARFAAVLSEAMGEAYGLRDVSARNATHGTYADALERRRELDRLSAAGDSRQLRFDLAA
jgi:hypothetical protein